MRTHPQTPDLKNHRLIWRFIEKELEQIDFRGKTVLEIGAWDGYWSFYAEQHGAKSVLASDDQTQNWSQGEGIWLARDLLRSQIEVRQDVSIYELSSLGRQFDVIICFGVYYHLIDPFYGLAQIRHCCAPESVVLFEGDVGQEPLEPNEVRISYKAEEPAYFPSASALAQLMRSTYFTVASQSFLSDGRPRKWTGKQTRRPREDRALTVCRPFLGVNELHAYAPPFGLREYDTRFRAAERPA